MTKSLNGFDSIVDQLGSHDSQLAQNTSRISNLTVDVKADYGAIGDGSHDDTTSIQNAVNAIVKINGGRLRFPSGTYKITNKITIPFGTGFIIEGLSRSSVTIKQFTDNTSIFQFTNELTHSWTIRDISFDYANVQPSTNTLAIPIYFSLPSGTSNSGGMFNFLIEKCTFNNGYYAISQNQSAQGLPLWGVNIQYCIFGGNLNGAIYLQPNPSIGQPEINIENCYIQVTNMTQIPIQINSADTVLLKSVEFNGGTSPMSIPSVMTISTCWNVTLINCRIEQLVVGSNKNLWVFPQSAVNIIGCAMTGITLNASVTSYLINAGTTGRLAIHGFNAGGTLNSGATAYCAYSDNFVLAENLVANNGFTRFGKQPNIDADNLLPNKTKTRGDADVTLTMSDYAYQYFNQPTTANRTVTLPNTGVYDGAEFTIVKYATDTFTLRIYDPLSGKSVTIPSSNKGATRWRATSSGEWIPVAQSTFS